ncbi:MAG: hypothetical protein ACK5LP_05835 [Campylobacteraceae bacterium]
MDDIKVLEEIGLREVSRKTYIETKYLKYMVEKDFAKLNRANAIGFARVIKREYGLNLDSWIAEFEAFYKESNPAKDEEQIFIDTRPKLLQNKIFIVVIIVFLILLCGFLYSFFTNKQNNITNLNTNISQEVIVSPIVEQARENITNLSNTEVINENASTLSAINQEMANEPQNMTRFENEVAQVENKPSFAYSEAILKPNAKLWVGIIDLSDFKRKVYTQSEEIKIDLTKEQIIVTGHGNFELQNTNSNDLSLKGQSSVFLYVKDNTIKQITRDEFRALNKGKSW